MLELFGLAVFFGIVWYALKVHTHRWHRLAESYATGVRPAATAVKPLATLIMVGGGPALTKYAGVRIGVEDKGLSLRFLPPLSFYAAPLFLPFDEMTVKWTSWYLNAESYALTMARCSDIEIIVDDVTMGWLRESTDRI